MVNQTKNKCCDCSKTFNALADWQIRCFSYYRKYRDKKKAQDTLPPRVVVQYVQLPDSDGEWLRDNIKSVLRLCHPDRHSNSSASNKITRELIEIFKSTGGSK